ncbi:MAG: acetolactate synthase small subunit [Bacteroidetes bacterium]|nr:acetolactate synthase small subunit [Bacteroidota bacterium]MCL5034155.1 acetolactate synthase small subunit [Bacteroidota bacterium]
MKKHTISILVENKFGALNRIVGLFSARGYNIDSISVGTSEDDSVARVTIVSKGDDDIIEQIIKQLNKLVDVTKVVDLTYDSFVERELVLVKVSANRNTRPELMQISEIFRSKIIDISPRSITVEATGSEQKVDALIKMLSPFGIKEIARTGRVALKREFEGAV